MGRRSIAEIPVGQPIPHWAPRRCSRCGEAGHRRSECRALESALPAAPRRDCGPCVWCGKPGHRATTCPHGDEPPSGDAPVVAAGDFPGADVQTLTHAPAICDRCGAPWRAEWPALACLYCGRRLYGARELAAAVAVLGG